MHLLDLVDVVVGEVGGHIVGDLRGDEFGGYTAVDGRFVAVDALPVEVEVEVDVGAVGELHVNLVAVLTCAEDGGLREVGADEGVDFRIVGGVSTVVSATVSATVVSAADDVEVGVELDFVVVVEFNVPAVVFLLDLVDVVVGEVGADVGRNLLRHDAGGHAAVDGRMLAVHFNPVKRMGECQFGLVVEAHLVVVLRLMAVVDAGLGEMGFDKLHDGRVDVALAHKQSGFILVLAACSPCCCFGWRCFRLGAGHSCEGQCHGEDE